MPMTTETKPATNDRVRRASNARLPTRIGTFDAFVFSDSHSGTEPIALVYGDIYYTLLDRGFLLAHDVKTGKQIYGRQRISVDSSGFTTSPWAYNGKIFALSEDGDTFVIQAGSDYRLIGKNSLGEMCMATPAIARDSLIIRTASRLYRIRNTEKK
jgi:GTP cyclohydrolase II